MTQRKFEIGMRVQVTDQKAPAKLKGRVGTIKNRQPYQGYEVEFDDKPGARERVISNWMESLTLDGTQPRGSASTHPQDEEKRRSPRYEADCFVAIEFQGHRVIGKCVDHSYDGFGAIVDYDLPLGWIASIEVAITGRRPLHVQARPIYRKGSRYGFEFVLADQNTRMLVFDFFREHAEDSC